MRYSSRTERLAGLGVEKWAIHFEARKRALAGERIIELTIGEPDTPAPQEIIDKAIDGLQARRIRYSAGNGEPAVLKALADKYTARTGRAVTTANIAYMPGTQAALYNAMATLAEPGDEVLVGDPLYATYEGVIRASGADMVTVALNPDEGFHMKATALEARITPRSRVILLNSPHNPTGATLSAAEIAAIVDVARRHDLWIISDEVYEKLAYGAAFASPFDTAEGADRTVVVSSLSKSHMVPGFRSGWCAGPAEFIRRLMSITDMAHFGSQPFLQDAAAFAIAGDFEACHVSAESLARRAAVFCEQLGNIPGIACTEPEGGMFAMVDVRGTGLSGAEFAYRLLDEENVAVMPGASFGINAAGHVRVSLTVEEDVLREAAGRIGNLARRLRA